MNSIQHKAAVAGYLHALKESKDVRDQWYEHRRTADWDGLCVTIGATLGLAQRPSRDDLEEMRKHADAHFKAKLDELHELDARIEPGCTLNGMDRCPPIH